MSMYATRCFANPTAPLNARTQDLAANVRAAVERFTALPADNARATRELAVMLAPRLQEAIANLPDGLVRTNLVNTREILDDIASGKRVVPPGGLNAQLSMMTDMLAKAYATSQFPERATLRRALGAFATLPNAVAAKHTAPPPPPAPQPATGQLQQRYDAMMAWFEAKKAQLEAMAKQEAAAAPAEAAAAPEAPAVPADAPPAAPVAPPQNDGVGAVVTGIARGAATIVGGVLATVAGIGAGFVVGPIVGAMSAWNGIASWFGGGQK